MRFANACALLATPARAVQRGLSPAPGDSDASGTATPHSSSCMASLDRLSRPPVVVVVSDEEWASRSLESLLGPRGYAVLRMSSGSRTIDLVRTTQPDALILNARTDDLSAIEVCRSLRDDTGTAGMPIIVTANDGGVRSERLQAFAAGAWDYCTQPIDGEVLLLKLATFLRAKQVLDHAREGSLIDEPTGLYTLRGLTRRAQEIGAEVSRKREALACIAFAPHADMASGPSSLGGSDAAAIAEHVARVCRRRGRMSDVFGRMGTMEFAVLAPATDDRGAAKLLARLQDAMSEGDPPASTPYLPVRLLAGVASVPDFSTGNSNVLDLLLRASEELRKVRVPAPQSTL